MPQAYEPYFTDLINLLVRMIEAVRPTPLPPESAWKNDAQVLALKLIRHALSLKLLSAQTQVRFKDGGETAFVDHASMKAVARALLETHLVFFYVFGSGLDAVTAYRYLTWKLGGLMDRVKLTATTPENVATLLKDRKAADELIADLKAHPLFQTEPPGRKKLLPRGDWKAEMGWQAFGVAAGFHPVYFKDTYSFLCGYSHSSWASALQISQAKTVEQQANMAETIMGMSTSVLGHFINAYSGYFPAAKAVLLSPDEKIALTFWSFGKAEMDSHYNKAANAVTKPVP